MKTLYIYLEIEIVNNLSNLRYFCLNLPFFNLHISTCITRNEGIILLLQRGILAQRQYRYNKIRIIGFKVRFAIERFYIRWKSYGVVSGYSDRRRGCNESGPPTPLIDFSRNPGLVYQPLHNRLFVAFPQFSCVLHTHVCTPI